MEVDGKIGTVVRSLRDEDEETVACSNSSQEEINQVEGPVLPHSKDLQDSSCEESSDSSEEDFDDAYVKHINNKISKCPSSTIEETGNLQNVIEIKIDIVNPPPPVIQKSEIPENIFNTS